MDQVYLHSTTICCILRWRFRIFLNVYCKSNDNTYFFIADGNWGSWETWGACSKTCGTGSRLRSRHCNDPPAMNGGADCVGDNFEQDYCSQYPCTTLPTPGSI